MKDGGRAAVVKRGIEPTRIGSVMSRLKLTPGVTTVNCGNKEEFEDLEL